MDMNKDHFLVLVSKDIVTREYGSMINNWPPANFWAMVSTIKSTIRDEQILPLMAKYKISELSDFPL